MQISHPTCRSLNNKGPVSPDLAYLARPSGRKSPASLWESVHGNFFCFLLLQKKKQQTPTNLAFVWQDSWCEGFYHWRISLWISSFLQTFATSKSITKKQCCAETGVVYSRLHAQWRAQMLALPFPFLPISLLLQPAPSRQSQKIIWRKKDAFPPFVWI